MSNTKKAAQRILLGAGASIPLAAGAMLLSAGAASAAPLAVPELPKLPDINLTNFQFPGAKKKSSNKKAPATNAKGLAKETKQVPAPAPIQKSQIDHALVESNVGKQLQKVGIDAKLADAIKKPLANVAINYAEKNPDAIKDAQAKAQKRQQQCTTDGKNCEAPLDITDIMGTVQEHVGKLANALQNQDFKDFKDSKPDPFKDRSNQTAHDHTVNGIGDFIDAFALDPVGLINKTINEAGGLNAIISNPVKAIAQVGVKVLGVEGTKDMMHVLSFAVVATRETIGIALADGIFPLLTSLVPAILGGLAGGTPFALTGAMLGALSPTSILGGLLGALIGGITSGIPGALSGALSGLLSTLPLALLPALLGGSLANILYNLFLQVVLYGGIVLIALGIVLLFAAIGFIAGLVIWGIIFVASLFVAIPLMFVFFWLLPVLWAWIFYVLAFCIVMFSSIVGPAAIGAVLAIWLFAFVGLPLATLLYAILSGIGSPIAKILGTLGGILLGLLMVGIGTIGGALIGGIGAAIPGAISGYMIGDLLSRIINSIIGAALLGIPAALITGLISGIAGYLLALGVMLPAFTALWAQRMNKLLDQNDRQAIMRFLRSIDEAINGPLDERGNRHKVSQYPDQNDGLGELNNLRDGERSDDQSNSENGFGKDGTQNRDQSMLGQWWNNLMHDLANTRLGRAATSIGNTINNALKLLWDSNNAKGDGTHSDALGDMLKDLFDHKGFNKDIAKDAGVGAIIGAISGVLGGGLSGLLSPLNLLSAIPGYLTGSLIGFPLGALLGQVIAGSIGDAIGNLASILSYIPILAVSELIYLGLHAGAWLLAIITPLIGPFLFAFAISYVVASFATLLLWLPLAIIATISVIIGLWFLTALVPMGGGLISYWFFIPAIIEYLLAYAIIIGAFLVSVVFIGIPVFWILVPFFALGALSLPLLMLLGYPLIAIAALGGAQIYGKVIGSIAKILVGIPLSFILGTITSMIFGSLGALGAVAITAITNALFRAVMGGLLGALLGEWIGALLSLLRHTQLNKLGDYIKNELPSLLKDLGKIKLNPGDLDKIGKILKDCVEGIVAPRSGKTTAVAANAVSLPVAASPLFTLSNGLTTEIVATQNVSKVLVHA